MFGPPLVALALIGAVAAFGAWHLKRSTPTLASLPQTLSQDESRAWAEQTLEISWDEFIDGAKHLLPVLSLQQHVPTKHAENNDHSTVFLLPATLKPVWNPFSWVSSCAVWVEHDTKRDTVLIRSRDYGTWFTHFTGGAHSDHAPTMLAGLAEGNLTLRN